MGVFLLIQIWSDFFIVLQKLCVWWWWWWRGGGGVLACHTALFTCWQWILPLISMQVAKESFFFLFSFLRSQISKLWNLQYTSLCKRLCCIHWFFHNNVVWIDFNYYSIHLYQEESNPSIEHPSFLSMCSTTIWNHWMDWNECCCKTMHGGYNIESWF